LDLTVALKIGKPDDLVAVDSDDRGDAGRGQYPMCALVVVHERRPPLCVAE